MHRTAVGLAALGGLIENMGIRLTICLGLPLILSIGVCARPTPTAVSPLIPMSSPWPTATPPPTSAPTVTPSALPTSTSMPSPTPIPKPTLVPTIDPTALPDLLNTAFTVQQESGMDGHPLRRVTGWEYGLCSSHRYSHPYRWLDNAHLLLFPLVGERENEMFGAIELTQPVVVNLNSGDVWLPAWDGYQQPLWSDALQVLIVRQEREILLLDADGHVIQRYTDSTPRDLGIAPLHLSPSGRRLLAGFVWRDLETGRTADFSGQCKWTMGNPGWSSDETRLFDCCFGYADANTGEYGYFWLGELHQVGRGGGGPLSSRWVLSDTRVMVEWDFYDGDKPAVPLIDPQAQAYVDLCDVAGLPGTSACAIGVFPSVAPDGEHVRVDRYIVDLRTFVTYTIPSDFGFSGWSPDGQFALLAENWDPATGYAEYQLLSLADGNLYPVTETPGAAPAWGPLDKHLAFLAEDGDTLVMLDVETWTTHRVLLSQPSVDVFWHPQGDGLAVLAQDGGLWWISDLTTDTTEPLTPPLPGVHDVRWSPDGSHLAFVSGTDVYVVSISEAKPGD